MSCRPNIVVGHRAAGACLAVLMGLAALLVTPVAAAPVPVRFPEGVTHGFLLVRSLAGDIVGHGEITQRVSEGDLLESHLVEGRQDIRNGRDGLLYGQSVTDGCIGWDSTEAVLENLAAAVRSRRRHAGVQPAPP